jgi:CubicO group peptidase (beta-lactamase class C family)
MTAANWRAIRKHAKATGTAALFIVKDGVVIEDWGKTKRKFMCHSIRKSFLSCLYGIQIEEQRIDVSQTLADLEIDDNDPSLTVDEKRATVLDLLKARSGVYHPALAETPEMIAARPVRGSHRAGDFWYYNNWDFNALGTIFEQETGATTFQEFVSRIAIPIGMEDFRIQDAAYVHGATSIHPAYAFRVTARDLARFGYLFAQQGRWGDRQIVPASWIRESTCFSSDASRQFLPGDGYGYMWWVRPKYFFAWGVGGHYVAIASEQNLVVVHRVNTDKPGKRVSGEDFALMMELIFASCGA